jgi:hypothetical protein
MKLKKNIKIDRKNIFNCFLSDIIIIIMIDDINNIWKDVNSNYNDMMYRLQYVITNNKKLLENPILKDKLLLLSLNLNDINSNIEKISCVIDDSNYDDAYININKNINTKNDLYLFCTDKSIVNSKIVVVKQD